MLLIAPVAIVLVAENLGHVKAVAAMTGRNLDAYLGRAFLGDGIATMVAGAGGGTGVTTYAENIGVMAVTKIYSTLVFVVAAITAIVLGFSPKFGALIMTIPGPVLSGLAIVVFGLITATGARIWVQNHVDFSRARNLVTVAVTLTIGAGDLALKFWGFTLGRHRHRDVRRDPPLPTAGRRPPRVHDMNLARYRLPRSHRAHPAARRLRDAARQSAGHVDRPHGRLPSPASPAAELRERQGRSRHPDVLRRRHPRRRVRVRRARSAAQDRGRHPEGPRAGCSTRST